MARGHGERPGVFRRGTGVPWSTSCSQEGGNDGSLLHDIVAEICMVSCLSYSITAAATLLLPLLLLSHLTAECRVLLSAAGGSVAHRSQDISTPSTPGVGVC